MISRHCSNTGLFDVGDREIPERNDYCSVEMYGLISTAFID